MSDTKPTYFNPHDRVWVMCNNKPVECRIYQLIYTANVFVIDGEISSVDVSYIVVSNYSAMDKRPMKGKDIFTSRESLVQSLMESE